MASPQQSRLKRVQQGPTLLKTNHRRRLLRLLFVDDSAANLELCLLELKKAQFSVRADLVRTPAEVAERLRALHYDVVLVENSFPKWKGTSTLEYLKHQGKDIPAILVTSKLTEEDMAEFIEKGAFDWVATDDLARLPLTVALAMAEASVREERRRAEKELRRSEAHYRALTENPIHGICRCTPAGKFLEVNQALMTMLGYQDKEELLAVNLMTDIMRDPSERAQVFDNSRRSGRVNPIEVEWRRKDGTPMKAQLSGREVHDDLGELECFEFIALDITQQRVLVDELRQQAESDPLTGLANYRRLLEVLHTEFRRSERTARSFAVLLFDLDGLKQINDSQGHLAGNRALCRLADEMRSHCRSIDTAARYGGDEFALILPETGAKAAGLVARRVCQGLAENRDQPGISASFGIGVYPGDGETVETLLHAADHWLYIEKDRKTSSAVTRG